MEHGTFTPLVMSTSGRTGRESSKIYSCLSELLSENRKTKYCVAAIWIWQKNIYALIKSIVMSIRGSRSVFYREKLKPYVKENEFLSELPLES